jgi:hypothetical protein
MSAGRGTRARPWSKMYSAIFAAVFSEASRMLLVGG